MVAQRLKRLPGMRETQVRSLGWEDPLKEMATHSSILAWEIPWTEEPGGVTKYRTLLRDSTTTRSIPKIVVSTCRVNSISMVHFTSGSQHWLC